MQFIDGFDPETPGNQQKDEKTIMIVLEALKNVLKCGAEHFVS